MGILRHQEIDTIEQFLEADEMQYDPLKVELIDHLICDTEQRMHNGMSFHEAWQIVKNEIPNHHLKQIETETMEMIQKKPSRSYLLIYGSIGLLSLGAFFKLMHLPGAATLVGLFLLYTVLLLVFSSLRSVYVNKGAVGNSSLVIMALMMSTFFVSITFKILHLPGAGVLFAVSSIGIPIVFIGAAIMFFTGKWTSHPLLEFIDVQENNIERIILITIGLGYLLNLGSLMGNEGTQIGTLFFIFSIICTGIYLFVNTWSYYILNEYQESKTSLLLGSSVALILFFLPLMGTVISIELRNFMAYGAYLIMAIIVAVYYTKHVESTNKSSLIALCLFFIIYPIIKLGVNLNWVQGGLEELTTNAYFNTTFLSFLIILLAVYRKEKVFRLLLILTIANFMIPSF
ncbi:MAG: hypothetical protein JXQ90_13715 [Cyclobacteriaceae bacterium]